MARSSQLEDQLSAATRRFVAEVVALIRQASFSDVAGFDARRLGGASANATAGATGAGTGRRSGFSAVNSDGNLRIGRGRRAGGTSPNVDRPSSPAHVSGTKRSAAGESGRRPRQTAERRAELGERILDTLRAASGPMGVRALASELHVAPDLLNAPLLELRAAGKVAKHGEKRATTYAMP